MDAIRIGTRGSKLALTQTKWVAARLQALHPGLTVDIEIIRTTGDRIQDRPLEAIGVKGAFTKELDIAQLEGAVDVVVHSLKDLPTTTPDGLVIAAIPERADARDGFFSRTGDALAQMSKGARIGTSSLRRRAQLLAMRPDIEPVDIRGNIDTRLEKMRGSGQVDGIVLALAGVGRLGMEYQITEALSISEWLPAPGQGALAVTARSDDEAVRKLLSALDDPATRVAVSAERAVLARVEGGCHVPLGAYATVDGDKLALDALIAAPNGELLIRTDIKTDTANAVEAGTKLAEILLEQGGAAILAALEHKN